MDDLISWLRAAQDVRLRQLDEDERVALAAQSRTPGRWHANSEGALYSDDTGGNGYFATGPWGTGITDEVAEHIVLRDPERVLAEVDRERKRIEAERRVLDEWNRRWLAEDPDYDVRRTDDNWCDALTFAVKTLAQPYAGQPGWREEWRPTS